MSSSGKSLLERQPALCQLPSHVSVWPIRCQVVRYVEDEDPCPVGTKVRKVEIECEDRVLGRLGFDSVTKRIIIPEQCLQSCITPDLITDQSTQPAAVENHLFEFRYRTFNKVQLKNVKVGDDVMWVHSVYGINFGKLYLVGTRTSNPFFDKEDDVMAFVAFPSLILTNSYVYRESASVDGWGEVYATPFRQLVLLSDYVKIQNAMENLRFVEMKRRGSEVVEVVYEACDAVGESSNEEMDECDNFNQASQSQVGLSSQHDKESPGDRHIVKALIQTKVSVHDTSISQKESQELKHTGSEVNARNVAINNSDLARQSNGVQLYSVGRGRAKLANKTVETTTNSLFRDAWRGIVGGSSANSQTDEWNTVGAGRQKKQTHEYDNYGDKPKIPVFASCSWVNCERQQTEVERVNLNDTVIAQFYDTMYLGTITMAWSIEKVLYAEIKFDKPLNSNHFELNHSRQRKHCTEKCRETTTFFIPIKLLLGNDVRSKYFNILPNSATEEPHQHQYCQPLEYAAEAAREEDFVDKPIDYIKYIAKQFTLTGIKGRDNSCYVDSVIFAMFAFTNDFDYCLNSPNSKNSDFAERNTAICNILKHDIVSPLRSCGRVESSGVQKLRKALSNYDRNFVGSMMDAEDFFLILFEKVCEVPKFYKFDNEDADFVFQIHVQVTEKTTADLQTLIIKTVEEWKIKLCSVPSPAFIVKLPVSSGESVFEKVRPTLEIDLGKILEFPLEHKHKGANMMYLSAIICLNSNHYTCFVKMDQGKLSPWVYFDSKPLTGRPEIAVHNNLSEYLEYTGKIRQLGDDVFGVLDFIFRYAYICIYKPVAIAHKETNL